MIDTLTASPARTDSMPDDRRRPGRQPVHPELLPLLRQPPSGDDLAPSRGIIFAAIIAVPMWAMICVVGHVVFRLL